MKKLKEEFKYGKKGITLIALVITIIVLLILAGVSIAMLTGENGVLTKATESKNETEKEQEKETLELAVTASQMKDIDTLELTKKNLEDSIKESFGNNKDFIVTDNQDGSFLVNMNDTGKMYYIDSSGEIIEQTKILKISTEDDLKTFRDNVNNGNTYEGYYIYLSNDITMNEEWNPIGKYDATSSNPDDSINRFFSGIFDGSFHKIYNLNINATEKSKGLFALIKCGTVKNLGIDSGNINSNSTVGGIVGYAYNNAQIINCYNKANITANDTYAGGIVGYAKQGVKIENCYNAGLITAKFSVAGIVGSIATNSEVINCYNIGNINATNSSGSSTFAAGISSEAQNNSTIKNCYSTGTIITYNSYAVAGIVCSANNMGDIKNNYFLESTVNGGNGLDIEGVETKNEEELKKIYTVLGNDFKEDTNNINNGYPILQWQ